MNRSIEALAHIGWEKAGKPEGKSLDFWLQAESDWKSLNNECLKLPVCPLCHQTESVSDNPFAIMNAGFNCKDCGIEWASGWLRRSYEENTWL